jgi:hypothetical protein
MIVVKINKYIAISVNEISDDITIAVSETSNLVNIEVAEIGLKAIRRQGELQGSCKRRS